MKKVFLFFALIILQANLLNAQKSENDSSLNWISNFETAKSIASDENKPILIFFTGSDWCALCKMLDEDFLSSNKFKKIALEKLILYKADFPRRTDIVSLVQKESNEKLDSKYTKTRSKRSFPTIVLTNAKGEELGFIESYNYIHDISRHFGLLDHVLKSYN